MTRRVTPSEPGLHRRPRTPLLVLGFLTLLSLGRGAEVETRDPGADGARTVGTSAAAPGSQAAGERTIPDRLILRRGDPLMGTILNEAVTLRTAYGELPLPASRLARLEFGAEPGGPVTVIAASANRFSGFLNDRQFVLRDRAGIATTARVEQLLQVVFRPNDVVSPETPGPHVLRLRNGDVLSGRILGEPLGVTGAAGEAALKLADVESVQFSADQPASAQITTREGGRVQGRWLTEDVDLKLDLGPELRLYTGWIQRIACGERRLDGGAGGSERPAVTGENAAGSATPPPGYHPDRMVWIQPGKFVMGSPVEEAGRDFDEGPQTRVTLTYGFWMAVCEVTQGEYKELMGNNPSSLTDDPKLPVERVTWREAMDYCERLSQSAAARNTLPSGYTYRLPTESEWEYACRAGSVSRFSFGDDRDTRRLGDYAWYSENSESMSHPVGTRKPNPWGLYDMHGNVLEWCLDSATSSLPGGSVTNYQAVSDGSLRIARGGSWLYNAKACRSSNRDNYGETVRCSDLGFRVVLAPAVP